MQSVKYKGEYNRFNIAMKCICLYIFKLNVFTANRLVAFIIMQILLRYTKFTNNTLLNIIYFKDIIKTHIPITNFQRKNFICFLKGEIILQVPIEKKNWYRLIIYYGRFKCIFIFFTHNFVCLFRM